MTLDRPALREEVNDLYRREHEALGGDPPTRAAGGFILFRRE